MKTLLSLALFCITTGAALAAEAKPKFRDVSGLPVGRCGRDEKANAYQE